ncbi:unnamed protein product [Rotaria sp. Silwood1]|nr:unnamed protein product [Rotaria sp. Silwood1]CAF4733527.1 unnamed protein product [Rotaria sp. Silwood1]
MINPSFSHNRNDAPIDSRTPIVKHSQQANESSKNTQPKMLKPVYNQNNQTKSNGKRDRIFVEHYSDGSTNQLEQILSYYRQDLKQESNTQLDCDRNLITRLVDFIRPEYSLNKNKMKDLDILFNEILNLNEKRFIKQKEKKNEQVQKEIANLKKLIVTSANKDHITKNISQINSMIDYKVWMEIEEETRKLYNLVERQRNQINELIKLIPLQGQDSSFHDITAPISKPPIVKQQPAAYNANVGSTLVTRVRTLAGQQQYSGINDPSSSPQSTQYECPICKQRFSGNDDKAYREHLSDCYSESDARF